MFQCEFLFNPAAADTNQGGHQQQSQAGVQGLLPVRARCEGGSRRRH